MARATKSRIPRRCLTKIEVQASPCKLFATMYKTNLVLYFSQALATAERSNSGLTKSTPHERGSTKFRSKLSRQSRGGLVHYDRQRRCLVPAPQGPGSSRGRR